MKQDKSKLDRAIRKITGLFLQNYRSADGFPVYDVDGSTGKPLSSRSLLSEFDDYAPFFWALGEHEYIETHFRLLKKRMESGNLLFHRPQIRQHRGLGLPGMSRKLPYADSQDYVEILYGLLELHALSGDDRFLRTANALFDRVVENFARGDTIRSFRLMPFGPTLPVTDAMSGMFIEIACDLAAANPGSADAGTTIEQAENWLRTWLDSSMFKTFGVFPSVILRSPWERFAPFARKTRLAELAKPNASMVYGILALAGEPFRRKTARDAFDRWYDGLQKYFITEEGVFGHFPDWGGGKRAGPILSTNFAILDILFDAVRFLDYRECLNTAIRIAEFFLMHQSPSTGLVPDEPGENRSYLDANSDFAVSLAKLSEITGDEAWREKGFRILEGVIDHHDAPFGYYRDVDLDTGKPLSTVVETRFCSLLLKPLILYRDDMQIYNAQGCWSLFRDR